MTIAGVPELLEKAGGDCSSWGYSGSSSGSEEGFFLLLRVVSCFTAISVLLPSDIGRGAMFGWEGVSGHPSMLGKNGSIRDWESELVKK